MSRNKVFAARFNTYWNGNTVSFSSKSMALRVGNTQVSITDDELADLEHARQIGDLGTPVQIYKNAKAQE